MIGGGSPKFAFLQAKSASKRASSNVHQVRGTSLKTIVSQKKTTAPRVEQAGASWNSTLEKGLVEVVHENMNNFCRTQNGWSPEGWKRIVQGFHEKFPHILFSKGQIQDKEKELKRDYRCLKDARTQSGASWDEKLGMTITDEPAVWNNIIHSFPRAKKFHNKPFLIFEALGELYDGQTAKGRLNFTSLLPTQVDIIDLNEVQQDCQNDISNEDDASIASDTMERETMTQLNQGRPCVEKGDKRGENIPKKRKKNGNVADAMEKYIGLRSKQVEEEMAREKESSKHVDEFSIKNCIDVLKTINELSSEERARAFEVFKDAQNREIFITSDPASRLVWLRFHI